MNLPIVFKNLNAGFFDISCQRYKRLPDDDMNAVLVDNGFKAIVWPNILNPIHTNTSKLMVTGTKEAGKFDHEFTDTPQPLWVHLSWYYHENASLPLEINVYVSRTKAYVLPKRTVKELMVMRKLLSKDLYKLKDYYDDPRAILGNILRTQGFTDEGIEGELNLDIEDIIQNIHIGYNIVIAVTLHKMPSGRFEIVSYIAN